MRTDGDTSLQNGIEQAGWKTTTGHISNESSQWYVETYEVGRGKFWSVAMFSSISPSSAIEDESGVAAMSSWICSRSEDIAILLTYEIGWVVWGTVWWKEDEERCSGREMGGWGHHMMGPRAGAWPDWDTPLTRPLKASLHMTSDPESHAWILYSSERYY